MNTKRVFDFIVATSATAVFCVPMALVSVAVLLSSKGPILYWSGRVGRGNVIFQMPKFRTMKIGAPVVATHLLGNPEAYLTPIGRFLRKSSLDELPQLYCVIIGHMSLVGPRPALFNQYDLIEARTERNIHTLLPGLTGWAQVNGRDELTIERKVDLDLEYLNKMGFFFDLRILFMTVKKVIFGSGVNH